MHASCLYADKPQALQFDSRHCGLAQRTGCPNLHVKVCDVARCRFVEQEVERVKVLFDQKEARLRSERDAARQQLEALRSDRDALEEQVGDMLWLAVCTASAVVGASVLSELTGLLHVQKGGCCH